MMISKNLQTSSKMAAQPKVSLPENYGSKQSPQDQADWIISMREKITEAKEYAAERPWDKWCIYRVPCRLKDAQDSKAYVPRTVSIGPYHHGYEQVQSMERHKWIALHRILEHTCQDIEMYIEAIKEVEIKARACYQQKLGHLSSNEFVEMMILDGCFIIEVFRCSPKAGGRSNLKDNPVIFNQRLINDILLDLVMLENQIPFFILGSLLELIRKGRNSEEWQRLSATSLVLNLFSPEWLTGAPLSIRELNGLKFSFKHKEYLHILDVFRQSLIHPKSQQHRHGLLWRMCNKIVPSCLQQRLHANIAPAAEIPREGQVVHSITELREAGVKVRKRNNSCFLDIKFKNGVLYIPPIKIQDDTLYILLNIAAFEHCHLKTSDTVIASYAVFMECLVKSSEDVCYLHRCGVLQHLLGNDSEVVDMFKSVSKEMLVDAYGGHYATLAEDLNGYYNRRRNRWRATLMHKYFSNPWSVISFVAAVILLLLTATQTFYAVYSYYSPNSR